MAAGTRGNIRSRVYIENERDRGDVEIQSDAIVSIFTFQISRLYLSVALLNEIQKSLST